MYEMERKLMIKFDEEKKLISVQGALTLRPEIEEIVDEITSAGFANLCWLGIGGTYASGLQVEVHMKEKSDLELFTLNAAEYLTTGNRRVRSDTIVVISSVTGSTVEMVDAVKKAKSEGFASARAAPSRSSTRSSKIGRASCRERV